jgi:hypothetical protein
MHCVTIVSKGGSYQSLVLPGGSHPFLELLPAGQLPYVPEALSNPDSQSIHQCGC